jgi:two-component system sensor histidine kinase YesM
LHKFFKNISIIKKLTLAYVLLILIPSIFVTASLYRASNKQVELEINYMNKNVLEQVAYSIGTNVRLIENIGEGIQNQSKISEFFQIADFAKYPFYFDVYRKEILPVVSNTIQIQRLNIKNISIFYNNRKIPEGYDIFYRDDRLAHLTWIQDFLKSKDQKRWFLLTNEETQEYSGTKNPPGSSPSMPILFVQKLHTNLGKYLGFIVIEVSPQDLFVALEESIHHSVDYFLFDSTGRLIWGRPPTGAISTITKQTSPAVTGGTVYVEDQLYMYQLLDPLGIYLGLVIPHKNPIPFYMISGPTIIFIMVLLASLLLFYIFLRGVFKKFNRNLEIMDRSIKSGFNERIEVDGTDELAQISDKFNLLLDKISMLIEEAVKRETAHKDAQLKALQYQINPHFIYNTLDIFSGKLELEGNFEVSEAITEFGQIIRYNLRGKNIYASISDEIQYALSYYKLQKLRYGDRLNMNIEVVPEIEKLPIIKLILQPLIENSIIHGLKHPDGKININVRFFMDSSQRLIIQVEDDGLGISQRRLVQVNSLLGNKRSSSSIGLANLSERLRLFYGNDSRLEIKSKENEYTLVTISIPITGE